MIKALRDRFNANFTAQAYEQFKQELDKGFPEIPFRVAETPVFIPADLKEKLIAAGETIIALIKQPDFKTRTQQAIPPHWAVPNENDHPHFLAFDYGLCQNEAGEIIPMLIEMQGFPSLFGFQAHLAQHYKTAYGLDAGLRPYFGDLNDVSYLNLLRKVIVGPHAPHQVALMDIDALEQKTAIDFLLTAQKTGIKVLALQDIHKEGRGLYYEENGERIPLKRIYNRLIFDEIGENTAVFEKGFDPREALDVEWVAHPNWFYRISKYTMPFLDSPFVPETRFLNSLEQIPADLENYVLKPLFSFAGMGVIIDVRPADIAAIKDPENWILQRKVNYAPLVKAPDAGVKAEIRMMYLWPDGGEPQLCINLARLSRGKMIGVRYNQDVDWVGGTVGLLQG